MFFFLYFNFVIKVILVEELGCERGLKTILERVLNQNIVARSCRIGEAGVLKGSAGFAVTRFSDRFLFLQLFFFPQRIGKL